MVELLHASRQLVLAATLSRASRMFELRICGHVPVTSEHNRLTIVKESIKG